MSSAVSGMLAPVSHLLTALSDMYRRSASSLCVQPFSLRSRATNAPNFFLSSSYKAFHLAHIIADSADVHNRMSVESAEKRKKQLPQ